MSTISAISSPFGKGGVAVIRISGDTAFSVLEKVFVPRSGKKITEYPFRNTVYGDIIKEGKRIDNGLAVTFKGPDSYTGEDTAELFIHGGITLAQLVLEATYLAGAVPARAGEFTERAFLNGKLSLTEAEAVADLIDSKSESMAVISASSASGALSKRINGIYDRAVRLLSSIYAYIDYPDEDLTDVSEDEMKSEIKEIVSSLSKLKNTYHTGKAVCEGLGAVIIGKPNVGKSSLLNLLLGEERAIVTPVPGTTRDTVEETAVFGKVLLRLCDTAGVRDTSDDVEKLGVERAFAKLDAADVVFAVFDLSKPFDRDDRKIAAALKALENKTVIALLNKNDLEKTFDEREIEEITPYRLYVSAKEEKTKEELVSLVEKLFVDEKISFTNDGVVTNARQYAAISSALSNAKDALDALEKGFTQDIAGSLLETALSYLGECDGRKVSDDVVRDIFGRFCVGK